MHGDPNMVYMHTPYHPDPSAFAYYGHATMDHSGNYPVHHQPQEETPGYYDVPAVPKSPEDHQTTELTAEDTPEENNENEAAVPSDGVAGDQTPYKYDPSKTPRSPYWGHLDATIAMGLATPQTNVKPENVGFMSPEEGADVAHLGNAQPLLLRQSQYYGYGPVSNYPPSPATQFMMSPQANFAYNYGYGYSPSPAHGHARSHYKHSPHVQGTNLSSSLKQAAPGLSPITSGRKSSDKADDRISPSTVETITESETISTEATN